MRVKQVLVLGELEGASAGLCRLLADEGRPLGLVEGDQAGQHVGRVDPRPIHQLFSCRHLSEERLIGGGLAHDLIDLLISDRAHAPASLAPVDNPDLICIPDLRGGEHVPAGDGAVRLASVAATFEVVDLQVI